MSDAAPAETRGTHATVDAQPEESSDSSKPSHDSSKASSDPSKSSRSDPSHEVDDAPCDDEPPSPERRLERYLARRAEDGEFYFKGKFIADDVGLTPSQIGTFLAELRESDAPFEIEPWSYSNATTWRVRPED